MDSKEADRRIFLKKGSAAVLASASFLSLGRATASRKSQVTLQLGWLASNGILGEVAADELGYFADAGMELNIVPGGPNIDGIASVASGRSSIGSISSSPSLMFARAAGIPVKCIAAGFQQHPFTYFSLSKNPVNNPQDLVGKTVATQGTARILLRALLKKNNISEDDVTVRVMGSDMAALKAGAVDVVTGWKTNTGALSVLGDERVDMTLWDAGIQLYANPYYVTDKSLKKDRAHVEEVIRIISRGWGWVYNNPEKAVDMLVARYPQLDKESELQAIELILGYSFNASTREHGWGAMSRDNWQAQIETYDNLDQFEDNTPALDDLVDFSVLETTAETRPKLG